MALIDWNWHEIWEVLKETVADTIRVGFYLGIIALALGLLVQLLSTLTNIHLLNPEEVISLWVAEVPLALFFRWVFGETIPDRPELAIKQEPIETTRGKSRYFCAIVNNRGRSTAEKCRGRITLVNWNDKDLLRSIDAEVTRNGRHRTLTCKVKWPNEIAEVRPDDPDCPVEFFRIRSLEGKHVIEIPSLSGWGKLGAVLLAKPSYRGTITVGASNAKPASRDFTFVRHGNKLSLQLT